MGRNPAFLLCRAGDLKLPVPRSSVTSQLPGTISTSERFKDSSHVKRAAACDQHPVPLVNVRLR
jgi:hypothetical protein